MRVAWVCHTSMQTLARATETGALSTLTEVRSSPIHGWGLFARQDIPADTVWWQAAQDNVLLLSQPQMEILAKSSCNPTMQELLKIAEVYGYYLSSLDRIIVCLDNARYVNHSDQPNSGPPVEGSPLTSIALRDIRAGEEITESYAKFDTCPWLACFCSPEPLH